MTRGKEQFVPIIRDRLKERCKAQKVSQKQIAQDLYFNPDYFSRCLSNGRVSKTWLIAIADYLHCDADWLSGNDTHGERISKAMRIRPFAEYVISLGYEIYDDGLGGYALIKNDDVSIMTINQFNDLEQTIKGYIELTFSKYRKEQKK